MYSNTSMLFSVRIQLIKCTDCITNFLHYVKCSEKFWVSEWILIICKIDREIPLCFRQFHRTLFLERVFIITYLFFCLACDGSILWMFQRCVCKISSPRTLFCASATRKQKREADSNSSCSLNGDLFEARFLAAAVYFFSACDAFVNNASNAP